MALDNMNKVIYDSITKCAQLMIKWQYNDLADISDHFAFFTQSNSAQRRLCLCL